MVNHKPILYGFFAGLGILLFYLTLVSIFQGLEFAFLNLKSLWYLIFPLAIGFGTQIGFYFSIRHSAMINATATTSGVISGGTMVACCSHFLLNIIPLAGASGLAIFLTAYQKEFLLFGILANIAGIGLMLNHKRKMSMKGGHCH